MTIGDSHLCIAGLHKELGPIIRVSPNELSFASVESIQAIYGHAPGKAPLKRGSFFMMLHSGFKKPNIVSELDQDRHRELRKIMLPAFSHRALQEQESVMSGMIDKWLTKISQQATPGSNGVEIGRWYALDALDILGELAFGESFQAVQTGRLDTRLNLSVNPYVVTLIDNLRHIDFVVTLVKLLVPPSLLHKNPNAVFSREQAERRLALGESKQDFVFPLVEKVLNGEMDKEEMASNMFVLTIAGQDTSVMSLLSITYLLLRNPDKLDRFVSEIRSNFDKYEDINSTKAQQIRYVQAVINESLRMIPPAPSGLGLPRVSSGFEIHGRYIPPDVEVFTAPWSLTHDPKYWTDPMEFKPERWLDPDCKDIKEASTPFSVGPTLCIGKGFSLMEINLILAKMFWKYDLELVNQDFDWIRDGRVNAGWWWPKLYICFHPRADQATVSDE
ncbi:cytochrome P450 [Penicillium capsulatum]|uniref:Cytochrome P450 n=1 Tax=Penicillium capsulatum TaxID=69766 RepID=A0A9W9IJ78_9EURO|nr:cytochrome P450 [Penicillium capsulatum]KAJ6122637.1 cytochrome P450 [Penicillium capsulatum]